MIFVTIGSHEPFDRLIRAVDAWAGDRGCGDQLFGQITERAGYRPQHFDAVGHLDPTAYQARFEAADAIVSHAGMGSIITALTTPKPIVVLPRRGHLNETRNDHQYDTLMALGHKPGLFAAIEEEALPALLDRVRDVNASNLPQEALGPFAQTPLTDALRAFIHS